VDILATIIKRTKADGQTKGVVPHLVDDGLAILQYADNTIFLIGHEKKQKT
jgi:hypothetical protein